MLTLKLLTKLMVLLGFSNYVMDSKFTIIKCEMPESMKRHALGTAMVAFEEPRDTRDDLDIAAKLSAEFDQEYGRHWFCMVGPPGFVSSFEYVPKTLLWFSYGDIQVILFKLSKLSPADIIREARRMEKSKVKIYDNEMSEAMKGHAIGTAMLAFQDFNSYKLISANISAVFNQMHGEQWQCIIGSEGFDAHMDYVPGTYISFAFGECQIIMYQTLKQVMDPTEIIRKARASLTHPVMIGYNTLHSVPRNELVKLAIEHIHRYDSFSEISKRLSQTCEMSYGRAWSVVVGYKDYHGTEITPCHEEALSISFGEIDVLFCYSDESLHHAVPAIQRRIGPTPHSPVYRRIQKPRRRGVSLISSSPSQRLYGSY